VGRTGNESHAGVSVGYSCLHTRTALPATETLMDRKTLDKKGFFYRFGHFDLFTQIVIPFRLWQTAHTNSITAA
jgi:hypothetical protein